MMNLSPDEHFTGGLARYDGKGYRINVYRNGSLAIEQRRLTSCSIILTLSASSDVWRRLRGIRCIRWYEDMAVDRFDPPSTAGEED